MKRTALLVLLAGCGHEPPPPAPSAFPEFHATSLPEPRALALASPGPFPSFEREVPGLDLPPPPPPHSFGDEPAWERHHGRGVSHPGVADPLRSGSYYPIIDTSVLESLGRLARGQSSDGSWMGPEGRPDEETTALVLLAFVRAGVTHRDPETAFGIRLNETVRSGLSWLMGRPRSGTPVTAVVFVEAYSSTRSLLIREPALRALEGLFSGTAGDRDWLAEALHQAERTYLVRVPEELRSRVALERGNSDRRLVERADPRVIPSSPSLRLATTRALHEWGAPRHPRWRAWCDSIRPLLDDSPVGEEAHAAATRLLTLLYVQPTRWRSQYGYRSA